jgi:hypothetical protein
MRVEDLMNALMKGITEGTIDGNTIIYLDPSDVAAMGTCIYETESVKINKVGNGYRVVIS